ncbi:MAG: rhomboid family intramembrane serine protease [Bacteroidetes bacterium]|nr:rhomboid family intramembrane serine protease [Bacteroidota bacterium]
MIIYLIILVTAVISIVAFNDRDLFDKLKFNAFDIKYNKQAWRFLTYGFLHVDWMHLLINMFVLYSFGDAVLKNYFYLFGSKSTFYFVLLYIGGILFATLVDFNKHKEDVYYNAVGASGAVSAIVFASIILRPTSSLYLFFIPFPIPSAIFGVVYLVYSAIMAKKANDNIGHSAHFWGALFGIAYTIALKPSLATRFVEQLTNIF